METQALRQQLQEDWEAGEAERQELLRQLQAQATASAIKVSLSDLAVLINGLFPA